MAYVNQLEFNWDKVIEVAVDWVSNGAGNIVESGVTAAVNIVSGFATFFIAFVFACYILLQKEKLGVQAKKFCLLLYRRAGQRRLSRFVL